MSAASRAFGLAIRAIVLFLAGAADAEGVKWRGIFINDEDRGLRPWACRHFGKSEGIGTGALREVFSLMKDDGLNLLWPAMHKGGYEFSERAENFALAKEYGIAIGSSHCEPMLRNNCYLPKEDRGKWSWKRHRAFLEEYWREGVRRGMAAGGEILWTIGMRGIHDIPMSDGRTVEEKIAVMEDVFKFQTSILPEGAPKLFIPYKEVLPLFNAGLSVPEDAVIMWTNDNYGYVRRLGGPQCGGYGGGIYWHLSYHGWPHPCEHVNPQPPAFMWYELVAKCWNNGAKDVWMLNTGDVFEAELLLNFYGKLANDPDAYGSDAQEKLLGEWAAEFLDGKDAALAARIAAHLGEYFTLAFNRRAELMCTKWANSLPAGKKAELLARYHALLAEDDAIESELPKEKRDCYFRLAGYQLRFLAYAGIVFLEGQSRDWAVKTIGAIDKRWNGLDGGKWAGFFENTLGRADAKHTKVPMGTMMWPWFDPPEDALHRKVKWKDYPATAYRADVPEPRWQEPVANVPANGGAWTVVKGLGTSGKALALLPVKPGVGEGAKIEYSLPAKHHPLTTALVVQFLPDFALWPGLGLGVDIRFDDGEPIYVEVPKHDSNIGEMDPVRNRAVMDNFIRVEMPLPQGTKKVAIIAHDPGVVIDRVGIKEDPHENKTR